VPVIVAANPKGGSGKSTCCLVLGTTLANLGGTVRIIDTDPQQSIGRWSEGQSQYRGLVERPAGGEELTDLIDRLASQNQFVIIDVQGSANQEMVAAMSRATMVLIPMQAKSEDASVATRAINLLRSQEKLFKRTIPHGIIFMRTNPAIRTREELDIRQSIQTAQIPCFNTSLHERTAYSHMFAQKLALDELNSGDTNGLEKAIANATALTGEIIERLRATKENA